jgi:threonine dehydrogenase-like Zn-dependent dehydrogenase
VGVPGVLDQVMRQAPLGSRIVVAGVCMEHDTIWPMVGINKELNLQFVFAYQPQEFGATLQALAEGIDVAPMVTGKTGVEGRRRSVPHSRIPRRTPRSWSNSWRAQTPAVSRSAQRTPRKSR